MSKMVYVCVCIPLRMFVVPSPRPRRRRRKILSIVSLSMRGGNSHHHHYHCTVTDLQRKNSYFVVILQNLLDFQNRFCHFLSGTAVLTKQKLSLWRLLLFIFPFPIQKPPKTTPDRHQPAEIWDHLHSMSFVCCRCYVCV